MIRKSVSLLEVLIAVIILSMVFLGILSAFVVSKSYVNRADKRIIAANLAREQLNKLYSAIRNDTWDTGNIGVGTTINLINQETIDSHTYNAGSVGVGVTSVTSQEYRQVTVNVSYPADN